MLVKLADPAPSHFSRNVKAGELIWKNEGRGFMQSTNIFIHSSFFLFLHLRGTRSCIFHIIGRSLCSCTCQNGFKKNRETAQSHYSHPVSSFVTY